MNTSTSILRLGLGASFEVQDFGDRVVLVSGFTELPPPPVPEPSAYALMRAGLAAGVVLARRRRGPTAAPE